MTADRKFEIRAAPPHKRSGMEINMQICRLYEKNLIGALELVRQVFMSCVSGDFEEKGVRTFEYFIRRENMEERMRSGEMVFFGAYESARLIGVIAMRSGHHVSLLFVDEAYQRRGVAKRLLRRGVAHCIDQNPMLRHITVNASPVGVPAYKALGFYPLSEERIEEGMRFMPMRIDLPSGT